MLGTELQMGPFVGAIFPLPQRALASVPIASRVLVLLIGISGPIGATGVIERGALILNGKGLEDSDGPEGRRLEGWSC